MKPRYFRMLLAVAGIAVSAFAQTHPDLSGVWSFTIELPPTKMKVENDGKADFKVIDRGLAAPRDAAIKCARPFTKEPAYKPEFRDKVKYLFDHESKEDPVFYCGKPGVPRIGPPRKVVQLPEETIFFYEDISGDPYRIIPTDGRAHRKNGNPTYYGDSLGRWERGVFVVDVTNFFEDGWFGEGGYFHSDALHVTERFWRDGANLVWQATVEDPKVLSAPWTMAPKVVKPSTDPLEESPRCIETDSKLLVNDDHHQQR
jgi:hypothetical protein